MYRDSFIYRLLELVSEQLQKGNKPWLKVDGEPMKAFCNRGQIFSGDLTKYIASGGDSGEGRQGHTDEAGEWMGGRGVGGT